jgi:hypothetical protein
VMPLYKSVRFSCDAGGVARNQTLFPKGEVGLPGEGAT